MSSGPAKRSFVTQITSAPHKLPLSQYVQSDTVHRTFGMCHHPWFVLFPGAEEKLHTKEEVRCRPGIP